MREIAIPSRDLPREWLSVENAEWRYTQCLGLPRGNEITKYSAVRAGAESEVSSKERYSLRHTTARKMGLFESWKLFVGAMII